MLTSPSLLEEQFATLNCCNGVRLTEKREEQRAVAGVSPHLPPPLESLRCSTDCSISIPKFVACAHFRLPTSVLTMENVAAGGVSRGRPWTKEARGHQAYSQVATYWLAPAVRRGRCCGGSAGPREIDGLLF